MMERLLIESGSHHLASWFFAPDSAPQSPLPGLVYCSGFPGSEYGLKIGKALSNGGYAVLKFDYRGIRESEGELDFASQGDDLKAGLTYLETRQDVNRNLIGVVGHSAGAAVAIVTAARDPRIKAVAVWGALGNYKRFLRFLRSLHGSIAMKLDIWLSRSQYRGKHVFDQMMSLGQFDPMDHVMEISPRPLLIIHQRHEIWAPVQHAYDLYQEAREPKKLVIVEGWRHSGSKSFYSAERKDGAIRMTLDWLSSVLK